MLLLGCLHIALFSTTQGERSRRVRKRPFGLFAACVVVGCFVSGQVQGGPTQQVPSSLESSTAPARQFLSLYCVRCHNERTKTAGLMLDKIDLTKIPAGAEVWEKVVRKPRANAMPPPGMPRPDRAASEGLVASLETALDREAGRHPNPGRAAVHRLNRAEYANAIRDLLTIEIDSGSLL